MATTEVLAMVGATCGVLGTVTGILGTWMGWVGMRRTDRHKAMDLRVQLTREETSLVRAVESIPDLIRREERSRQFELARRSMLLSSVHADAQAKFAAQQARLVTLQEDVHGMAGDVSALSLRALEARLIRVHDVKIRADELIEECLESIAGDDQRSR